MFGIGKKDKKPKTAAEKHARKEKFKTTLANTLGGGERGLLTQKKGMPESEGPTTVAKAGEMESNEMKMSQENKAENLQSDIFGLKKQTGEDRQDMGSNATALFRKKKGYGSFDM